MPYPKREPLINRLTKTSLPFRNVFCCAKIDGYVRTFDHLIPPGARASHWIEAELQPCFHGWPIVLTSPNEQLAGVVDKDTGLFHYTHW